MSPLKRNGDQCQYIRKKIPEQDATTPLLGLTWNKNKDKIGPNWHLILTKKIKGISTGDNLTPLNIRDFVISRQTFTCFYAKSYSLGVCTPFLMSIKSSLRNICKMFGEKNSDYNLALKEKSQELHKETVTNMKKVLELKPNMPRSILKSHDYLTSVIVSSDGSTEGISVVAHFVSKTTTGNYNSHMVRAANKSSGVSEPGRNIHGSTPDKRTHLSAGSDNAAVSFP